MDVHFESKVFDTEVIQLADTQEQIVRGGRDKFHLLPAAFEGIKQIGETSNLVLSCQDERNDQLDTIEDAFISL